MTPELMEATDALKFITEHLKAEDEYDTVRIVDVISCLSRFYFEMLRSKQQVVHCFYQLVYYLLKSLEHTFWLQVLDDWKFVASVLDRLLLIVFLSVTIFGSMGILMQTPYILEYVDQDEIIQKLMKKYMK